MQDNVRSSQIILTQGSGVNDQTITWFEDGLLQKSFKLSERSEHGPLLMEPLFSCFKLSPDASHLMYVAHKKEPASKSFFSKCDPDQAVGDTNLYQEDWGEGLLDVHSSVICILDLKHDSLKVVSIEGMTLFEPFWITSEEIGFLGIEEQPRKLSFVFAFNRPTRLYSCGLNDTSLPTVLLGETEKFSLRSPRMSPNGSTVVLLEHPIYGPDMSSCKIIVYNFSAERKQTVVTNEASLYVKSLPERCWNGEGTTIYFNSIHKCRSLLWQLDVEECSLKRVRAPFPSATFISADHGLAIIKSSCINQMPQLFACSLQDDKLSASTWTPLTPAQERSHINYKIIQVKQKLHVILISPTHLAEKRGACIVLPHGGPFSASIDEYSPSHDRYVTLGFKVLLINYCGSTGYDDQTLRRLIGKVGKADLEDCMSAVSFLLEQKLIDNEQLFLSGCSWGGYLACLMASQHSSWHWVALASKSPVTDLTALAFDSDAIDFCWSVVLATDFKPKDFPLQTGLISKMFDVSPIRWIATLETPSITFLGSHDRCVPMAQGLAWHKSQKDRGLVSKCHVYPDGHSLRKLTSDSDIFVNTVIWFLTHLKSGPQCIR